MAEKKRPRGRKKNVTGEGQGLFKREEGLGTGPVGSQDGYAGKKADKDKGLVEDLLSGAAQQAMGGQQSGGMGDLLGGMLGGQSQQGGNQGADLGDLLSGLTGGQSQQGGQSSQGSGLGNILGSLSDGDSGQSQQSGLGALGSLLGGASQQNAQQQNTQQQTQQSANPFAQTQSGSGGGGGTIPLGAGTGGAKKKGSCLRYIILALIIFFVISMLMRCMSGGGSGTSSIGENTLSSGQSSSSTTQSSQSSNNATVADTTTTDASNVATYSNGNDILSQLFGSTAGTGQTYSDWGNAAGNSSALNTQVASGARPKYTTIRGNGQDVVTIMVYMCGTDLESRSGMATSDLMEMTKAQISENVNIIVFTGGCQRWNNQVVSSEVNQVYKVESGGLARLVDNAGNTAMTSPQTLSSFIQWAAQNYPANRNALIFWDHGSGSVAGYGYDEKNSRAGSMSLAGIKQALAAGGTKFDFVGFDTCLLATAENALMLNDYADYMVASEETEPGVGWYYTDWITALSNNTSMPTTELGKNIIDSFVAACNKTCPGQLTTLSLIDVAEFAHTVPDALSAFSKNVSSMVTAGDYKTVSNARYNTREFAQSTRIDQVDLIDLCDKIGTNESKALADALRGAVKYNRTSSNMTNAYGVSVFFPYGRSRYLSTAVSTFNEIGLGEDYTKCLQEVAGMAVSGQVSSGSQSSPFGSLFGDYDASSYATGDSDAIAQLLGSFFGGNTSGYSDYSGMDSSALSYFTGRSMPIEDTASYIADNSIDPAQLVWQEDENGDHILSMSEENWQLVHDLDLNIFYDDGEGYIDLGLDNIYEFDDEGNMKADRGETWLAINDQIVAYYHLSTVDDGENYQITGRIPAFVNGERADIFVAFDNAHEEGYVTGVQYVTDEGGLSLIGKIQGSAEDQTEGEEGSLTEIGAEATTDEAIRTDVPSLQDGDVIEFICDYYDYDGNYQDSYKLGNPITVNGDLTISDVTLPEGDRVVTYRLTDIYDREYWTEAIR